MSLLRRDWGEASISMMMNIKRLAPVSSSKQYSRQILPILLKVAATSLDKLPKSIKDAIIDPALSEGQGA